MEDTEVDIARTYISLLPGKSDRLVKSRSYAIRLSRHYKSVASAETVCNGVFILFLLCCLFRFRHSKVWKTFESNHPVAAHHVSSQKSLPKDCQEADSVTRRPHLKFLLDLCAKGWVGFGSLLLRVFVIVITLCLIMSGDVEVNPGPNNSKYEVSYCS